MTTVREKLNTKIKIGYCEEGYYETSRDKYENISR
jgi:hypothetical protein